jgi:hypothetical protein
VTATCFKWWQRSDSGVWWRPVSGGALGLCVHDGMRIHPSTEVVSSRDDGGCCHERRMPLLSRFQTSRELASSLGTKLPQEGGSVADSIRGNLYCLARELAFLAMR